MSIQVIRPNPLTLRRNEWRWRKSLGMAVMVALIVYWLHVIVVLPWLFGGTELPPAAPLSRLPAAAPADTKLPLCRRSSAKIDENQTAEGGSVSTVLHDLARLSHGLLFPSESDYPLEPFAWDNATPFSAEALVRECGYPAGTPVEIVDVDYFFRNVVRDEEWHTPEERATVRRYRKLLAYFKHELADVQVYRVGTIRIDAYILGKTRSGHMVGLKTTLIET